MKSLTEYLIDAISNTKLFEMAMDKQTYQKHVYDLSNQIIENWCLSKYCTMYDNTNPNHNHWQSELWGHVQKLQRHKLKSGSKQSYTKQVLIKQMELNNINEVITWLESKWEDENLPKNTIHKIADAFVNELNFLIRMISDNKAYNELKQYCYIL